MPGTLTRRYLDGKRASYLRPFRLYAVASLVLFGSVLSLQAPDAERVDLFIAGEEVSGHSLPGDRFKITLVDTDSTLSNWIRTHRGDQLEGLKKLPPQQLLDALFLGLRRSLPLALVAFLPVLALVLKLLYVRTGTLLFEPLIFGTHLQSALFLTMALYWVISKIAGFGAGMSTLLYLAGFLVALVTYLPLALRRVYGQGWGWTLLKSLLLLLAYFYLLGLAVGSSVVYVLGTF